MVVIDASVLATLLTEPTSTTWFAADSGNEWHSVPHLHAEVFSAVRGLVLGRKLDVGAAERSLAALVAARVTLVEMPLLMPRMWELRHNLSAYDAAYVAAAELLGCPLVTEDAHLAAAPGIRCEVRLAA